MDFRQLQYIVKVAETGNITRAAAELFIAQPSLSNYISKAEKELGVTLFDRSTSPLKLTFAGEEYLKDAKQILYIQEQMHKKLHDISSVTRGRIRLGIPTERGSFMLPLILPQFKQKFPDIEVQVTTAGSAKLKEALRHGDLDFYILPTPVIEKDCEYFHIYDEELLLCAGSGIVREEHLIPGYRDTVDISKCSELPFLRVEGGRSITDITDILFHGNMMQVNPVFVAHGVGSALRLAASGMGVTIVPRMTLDLIRYDHSARIYSIGTPPLFWEISAVYRKDAYLGHAERSFIEMASQIFKSYSYHSPT